MEHTMLKALILNDTSSYHNGCKQVMHYLRQDLANCGYTVAGSIVGRIEYLYHHEYDLRDIDLVIINGEGSMHHDRLLPQALLKILTDAKKLGKKTALINTVWQAMTLTDEHKEVLQDTYISVRECLSQQEFEKDNISSDIHLDLSYFADVPIRFDRPKNLVVGKFFSQKDWRPEQVPTIDIFKDSWNDVVQKLSVTKWLVTGRHHEIYAACKARCNFVALSGNTWKNEGLAKTANVDIIFKDEDLHHSKIPSFLAECKERSAEYTKLFDWMELQTPFTIAGKV
jgi:hypothetical protein